MAKLVIPVYSYSAAACFNAAVEQPLIQKLPVASQSELGANEAHLRADGKVVFQELNSGQTRVLFQKFGHETATAEPPTGALRAGEPQVVKMTLASKEPRFAKFSRLSLAPVASHGSRPRLLASTTSPRPKPWPTPKPCSAGPRLTRSSP